jgi:DNA polymerase III epsilon subunit-like protein
MAKARSSDEVYVSVDIEADGKLPGLYSMVSLGACNVYDTSQSFYAELKPISEQFDPAALAVSGLSREHLVNSGRDPAAAMGEFLGWVKGLGGRPVFASFSTWDWSFVYYYLIRFTGKSPFGHSSLDMKSYYMGRFGARWGDTAKRKIAEDRPQLLRGLGPHTHDALDDAKEQAELFRRMMEEKG